MNPLYFSVAERAQHRGEYCRAPELIDSQQSQINIMLTLLDRIYQKLPQAPESVLAQVWTLLNADENNTQLSEATTEDRDLDDEFDRWEAASDEDEAQIETMLKAKGI